MDRELDDVLEVGDSLYFIDMSLLATPADHPTIPIPSDTFIPQLDSQSVSTFGTIKTPRPSTVSASTPTTNLDNDSGTVISAITMDSRISTLESCVSNVEILLKQVVSQSNIGVMITPPDTSQSAGAAHATSAFGV